MSHLKDKEIVNKAVKMTKWLRTVADFAEDSALVPSTQVLAYNHL